MKKSQVLISGSKRNTVLESKLGIIWTVFRIHTYSTKIIHVLLFVLKLKWKDARIPQNAYIDYLLFLIKTVILKKIVCFFLMAIKAAF